MDQFPDGHHLWLRSREHGTYLHADEDGHGVSLSRRRASMNAAWAVHRNHGDDQHVLLYSAAYGRYLVATDASAPRGCRGFRVEQRNYDGELEQEAIRWQALTNGSGDYILLRNAAYGRYGYLRANGRHPGWNEAVVSVDDFPSTVMQWVVVHIPSVDPFDNFSTMMEWVVVPIPIRQSVPRLPRPNWLAESLAALLPPWEVELMGYGEEVYPNPVWFFFRGWSVFRLRNQLAYLLGIMRFDRDDFVMYVRAGTHGRFTPLVVDLPLSRLTLGIRVELPANVEQRYLNVDAE
ncbi:unnamed protein product [Alopecurus aequalis]